MQRKIPLKRTDFGGLNNLIYSNQEIATDFIESSTDALILASKSAYTSLDQAVIEVIDIINDGGDEYVKLLEQYLPYFNSVLDLCQRHGVKLDLGTSDPSIFSFKSPHYFNEFFRGNITFNPKIRIMRP